MNRKRPPTGTDMNGSSKRTRLDQASSASRSQTTVHGTGRSTTRFGNHASPGVRIPVGWNDAAGSRGTDPHRRDSGSYLSDRYQSAATTSQERQQLFNSPGSGMETRARPGTTPTPRGYTVQPLNHYGETRRREHENRDSWSGLYAAGPCARIPVGTAHQTGRNYSYWRDPAGSYLSDEDQMGGARSNEGTRGYGIGTTPARSGITPRHNEIQAWIDSQRQYVEARRREETNRGNWVGPYHAGPGVRSPARAVGSVEDGRNYSDAARSHRMSYSQYRRDSGSHMREYQGGATSREREQPFIGNGIETRARSTPTPRSYRTWNHHEQARRREETEREVITTNEFYYRVRIRVEISRVETGRNSSPSNGLFNWPNESYALRMPRGSGRRVQFVIYEPEPPTNRLTAREIERLPSRLFVPESSGVESSQTKCLICLDDYEQGDRLRILGSCVHVFHSACVDTWLERNATCPTCRTAVTAPTV